MYCKQCGAENNDNAKFCSECGAELVHVTQPGKFTGSSGDTQGKSTAEVALGFGIASVVFLSFGIGALISIACGIVGLILASSAKKAGFNGGIYTGALVCSIIGVVGGAGVFLASLVFIGTISSLVRWIFSFT